MVLAGERELGQYEGRRRHLAPETARRVRVEVCPEHFPRGTRAWDNLATAVARINDARRVDVQLELAPAASHLDRRRLYASPRANDTPAIRVDYSTENPKGSELKASGAAFQLSPSAHRSASESRATHTGVLALNPERGFRRHLASPSLMDRGYDPADAPSLGVFSHELGHLLGFGHDEKRTVPELVGFAVHRGVGRHVTDGVGVDGVARGNADQRQGRLSAYAQWALERRYPVQSPVPDTQPEWHLHEVVAFPEKPSWAADRDGKPTQAFELADLVPKRLRATPLGYVDCRTGEPPVLTVQYSDTSNVASEEPVRVSITLGSFGTVAERSHRSQHPDAAYAQYTWTRSLHLDPAAVDAEREHSMPLRITVGDPAADLDSADNVFESLVLLLPSSSTDRRCQAARESSPR